MIPNYFKRLNSNESYDENQNKVRKLSDNKTDDQTRVPVTCSLKTVKKWMTELNIYLDYELENQNGKETDIVCKMWCSVCRVHSSDSTSSVSKIINTCIESFVGWIWCMIHVFINGSVPLHIFFLSSAQNFVVWEWGKGEKKVVLLGEVLLKFF